LWHKKCIEVVSTHLWRIPDITAFDDWASCLVIAKTLACSCLIDIWTLPPKFILPQPLLCWPHLLIISYHVSHMNIIKNMHVTSINHMIFPPKMLLIMPVSNSIMLAPNSMMLTITLLTKTCTSTRITTWLIPLMSLMTLEVLTCQTCNRESWDEDNLIKDKLKQIIKFNFQSI